MQPQNPPSIPDVKHRFPKGLLTLGLRTSPQEVYKGLILMKTPPTPYRNPLSSVGCKHWKVTEELNDASRKLSLQPATSMKPAHAERELNYYRGE